MADPQINKAPQTLIGDRSAPRILPSTSLPLRHPLGNALEDVRRIGLDNKRMKRMSVFITMLRFVNIADIDDFNESRDARLKQGDLRCIRVFLDSSDTVVSTAMSKEYSHRTAGLNFIRQFGETFTVDGHN